VVVTVQDNGVGFDGTRAQHLFGVFQRMHRESEFDGVGAGLALCQAIAQRHGAGISAQAAPGAGCTVHLDWPAPPSAAQ
jgi:light-regulated signal transduction histidine kinase (bacteriophytochrome)